MSKNDTKRIKKAHRTQIDNGKDVTVRYCKDALKLLNKKVVCGKDCPILKDCPRLILEDATDIAIEKAIKAMLKAKRGK